MANRVCPLIGNICPGVDNCAPAILDVLDSKETERECPIVVLVGSLRTIAAAAYPMALEAMREEPVEEEKPTREEERTAILKKIGIDQA